MTKRFSTAMQRVEYGLESIAPSRTVVVPLRDLLFVHQVLAEYVQFFHQPMHYPSLKSVKDFLGDRTSGEALQALFQGYYTKLHDMLPSDIHHAFDDGERFEHPLPPRYFVADDSQ